MLLIKSCILCHINFVFINSQVYYCVNVSLDIVCLQNTF